jgi:hypothetical protein
MKSIALSSFTLSRTATVIGDDAAFGDKASLGEGAVLGDGPILTVDGVLTMTSLGVEPATLKGETWS